MQQHTHPLVATEIQTTSVAMWRQINQVKGAVVGSRKACISSWAADKETSICSGQHNIAYPDILITLNLNCDKLRESKNTRQKLWLQDHAPALHRPRGNFDAYVTFWGTNVAFESEWQWPVQLPAVSLGATCVTVTCSSHYGATLLMKNIYVLMLCKSCQSWSCEVLKEDWTLKRYTSSKLITLKTDLREFTGKKLFFSWWDTENKAR